MGEIVSGGDDYEILCAVPDRDFEAFAQAADSVGVAVSSIGTIIAGNLPPRFLDQAGTELPLTRVSYSHFQDFDENGRSRRK
jgi:thiamine-monophosphate kinase